MTIAYASLGADILATALTSQLEIRAYGDQERKTRIYGKGFVAPINPASVEIEYSNKLAGHTALNSTGPVLSLVNNQEERISFTLVLTDSSIFHYRGSNVFTVLNNYESDSLTNVGYLARTVIRGLNSANSDKDFDLNTPNDEEMGKLNAGNLSLKGAVNWANRCGHVAVAIERFLNLTTQKVRKNVREGSGAAYLGLVWGRVFTRPGISGVDKGKKTALDAKRRRIYPCYLESVDINYTHFTRDGRPLRAELDCTFVEDSEGGSNR